jgi:hypothetical protein
MSLKKCSWNIHISPIFFHISETFTYLLSRVTFMKISRLTYLLSSSEIFTSLLTSVIFRNIHVSPTFYHLHETCTSLLRHLHERLTFRPHSVIFMKHLRFSYLLSSSWNTFRLLSVIFMKYISHTFCHLHKTLTSPLPSVIFTKHSHLANVLVSGFVHFHVYNS